MTKRNQSNAVLTERTTLWSIIISILLFISGITLLYLATGDEWWSPNKNWQTLTKDLGSLLTVTGLLSIIWELLIRRSFLEEILAKVGAVSEIRKAGLLQIVSDFKSSEIDWDKYFQKVNQLDLFFTYAQTWRKTHQAKLKELVARRGIIINVVLADYNDALTMENLARSYDMNKDELVRKIKESEAFYIDLRKKALPNGSQVNVWHFASPLKYSFYRFDDVVIIALYDHTKDSKSVPTMVCNKGGILYDFIDSEFKLLTDPNKGLTTYINN